MVCNVRKSGLHVAGSTIIELKAIALVRQSDMTKTQDGIYTMLQCGQKVKLKMGHKNDKGIS